MVRFAVAIALSSGVFFSLASRLLRRKPLPPSPAPLDWRSFTEFLYEGLKWVWRYDLSGHVVTIVPLCPVCFYQVDLRGDARPDSSTYYGLRDVTIFWCDHFKEVKRQLDGNFHEITIRVHKEINRLYDTHEWENIVRQQMTSRSQNRAPQ
jgi:hypothetical protein